MPVSKRQDTTGDFIFESKLMKIIVEIEATEWTQENIESFREWLQDQLDIGNMGTGDDARVVDIRTA